MIRRQHIHISLFRGRQRRRESNHQALCALLLVVFLLIKKTADSKKTGNFCRLFCFSAAEKTRENRRSSGGYPQRVWAGRWNPSPFDDLNISFFQPKKKWRKKKEREKDDETVTSRDPPINLLLHLLTISWGDFCFCCLAFECLFLFSNQTNRKILTPCWWIFSLIFLWAFKVFALRTFPARALQQRCSAR